jgi:hypothetical protein
MGQDTLNNEFTNRLAEMMGTFIARITPLVDELTANDGDPDAESNEEDATGSSLSVV